MSLGCRLDMCVIAVFVDLVIILLIPNMIVTAILMVVIVCIITIVRQQLLLPRTSIIIRRAPGPRRLGLLQGPAVRARSHEWGCKGLLCACCKGCHGTHGGIFRRGLSRPRVHRNQLLCRRMNLAKTESTLGVQLGDLVTVNPQLPAWAASIEVVPRSYSDATQLLLSLERASSKPRLSTDSGSTAVNVSKLQVQSRNTRAQQTLAKSNARPPWKNPDTLLCTA